MDEFFSAPVHKSLLEKPMFFGIGQTAFCAIAMVTVILSSMISGVCILLGIAAVLFCRFLCRKDNMLLEFIFQNLDVKEFYRG